MLVEEIADWLVVEEGTVEVELGNMLVVEVLGLSITTSTQLQNLSALVSMVH